jgi:hypothetical protein
MPEEEAKPDDETRDFAPARALDLATVHTEDG